ncbi:hypothetical protein [Nitrosopumilus sp. b2]|uniref:hypothetical protein n=1 Tax=Nitrosopumilus sp. b2 TaxID=2109908 RepID=UPI0015F53188|nr:hypothetical protein [Nitrosopumilus sp. b2]KAF6245000.1 hypothetical protein C6989_05490 [Nitrosopumilus sp. b2]
MKKLHALKNAKRKAVSTIIATLLMVAVAATGGTALFGFSQGFFNEQQVGAPAGLEQLEVTGFDATDSNDRKLHNANIDNSTGTHTTGEGKLAEGDRVYIYLLNKGSNPVAINELRFAGISYAHQLTTSASEIDGTVASGSVTSSTPALPVKTSFVLIETGDETSTDKIPELEPGQEVTIVLTLDDPIKIGRDAQLKITTAAGTEFTDVINIGQLDD